jgi:hypothetical protein
MVPLARRIPGESFLYPSDKTDPRFIAGYDAGLKDGILELQSRVAELEGELNAVRRAWGEAETWRQQAIAPQVLQVHQITEDMRQRMMLQAQAQQQVAQQNQGLAQQNYAQGLGQLGAQNDWPYCNCVPGRGGFLRGDN